MKTNNEGYIVVETVGAFVPFVLLVVSILSLVGIVTLQARVHYALTQAANTLSMYSYVIEAAGQADKLAAMDEKSSSFAGAMDSILGGINALSGKGKLSDLENAFDTAAQAPGDPKTMISNLAAYGLGAVSGAAAEKLAQPLVLRYLTGDEALATEYFERVRLANFAITECKIINSNDDIRLTATYEVEYTFGALKLPFGPTLRLTQTVATKAWLDGSGVGYK